MEKLREGNQGISQGVKKVGILGSRYLRFREGRYTEGVCIDNPPFSPTSVLTPSVDHKNRYGWQAGGTHLNGMLSGLLLISKIKNDSN